MAAVKCTGLVAVPLPNGRLLPPGRHASDVDPDDWEVRAHLDTGALTVVEPKRRQTRKEPDR
jgi:hypothetical protein